MSFWRITYEFQGKKYAIERKFEHEARDEEWDLKVYGCLTRADFVDEERGPREGIFPLDEAKPA